MKFFDTIAEVIGWIKIVIAPLAVGVVLGWIIYYNMQNIIGIVIGGMIAALGLVLGIYLANKAWKSKEGTVFTATRHMHSPDLDEKSTEEYKTR